MPKEDSLFNSSYKIGDIVGSRSQRPVLGEGFAPSSGRLQSVEGRIHSPTKDMQIPGYTQRRISDGSRREEYLLSLRETLDHIFDSFINLDTNERMGKLFESVKPALKDSVEISDPEEIQALGQKGRPEHLPEAESFFNPLRSEKTGKKDSFNDCLKPDDTLCTEGASDCQNNSENSSEIEYEEMLPLLKRLLSNIAGEDCETAFSDAGNSVLSQAVNEKNPVSDISSLKESIKEARCVNDITGGSSTGDSSEKSKTALSRDFNDISLRVDWRNLVENLKQIVDDKALFDTIRAIQESRDTSGGNKVSQSPGRDSTRKAEGSYEKKTDNTVKAQDGCREKRAEVQKQDYQEHRHGDVSDFGEQKPEGFKNTDSKPQCAMKSNRVSHGRDMEGRLNQNGDDIFEPGDTEDDDRRGRSAREREAGEKIDNSQKVFGFDPALLDALYAGALPDNNALKYKSGVSEKNESIYSDFMKRFDYLFNEEDNDYDEESARKASTVPGSTYGDYKYAKGVCDADNGSRELRVDGIGRHEYDKAGRSCGGSAAGESPSEIRGTGESGHHGGGKPGGGDVHHGGGHHSGGKLEGRGHRDHSGDTNPGNARHMDRDSEDDSIYIIRSDDRGSGKDSILKGSCNNDYKEKWPYNDRNHHHRHHHDKECDEIDEKYGEKRDKEKLPLENHIEALEDKNAGKGKLDNKNHRESLQKDFNIGDGDNVISDRLAKQFNKYTEQQNRINSQSSALDDSIEQKKAVIDTHVSTIQSDAEIKINEFQTEVQSRNEQLQSEIQSTVEQAVKDGNADPDEMKSQIQGRIESLNSEIQSKIEDLHGNVNERISSLDENVEKAEDNLSASLCNNAFSQNKSNVSAIDKARRNASSFVKPDSIRNQHLSKNDSTASKNSEKKSPELFSDSSKAQFGRIIQDESSKVRKISAESDSLNRMSNMEIPSPLDSIAGRAGVSNTELPAASGIRAEKAELCNVELPAASGIRAEKAELCNAELPAASGIRAEKAELCNVELPAASGIRAEKAELCNAELPAASGIRAEKAAKSSDLLTSKAQRKLDEIQPQDKQRDEVSRDRSFPIEGAAQGKADGKISSDGLDTDGLDNLINRQNNKDAGRHRDERGADKEDFKNLKDAAKALRNQGNNSMTDAGYLARDKYQRIDMGIQEIHSSVNGLSEDVRGMMEATRENVKTGMNDIGTTIQAMPELQKPMQVCVNTHTDRQTGKKELNESKHRDSTTSPGKRQEIEPETGSENTIVKSGVLAASKDDQHTHGLHVNRHESYGGADSSKLQKETSAAGLGFLQRSELYVDSKKSASSLKENLQVEDAGKASGETSRLKVEQAGRSSQHSPEVDDRSTDDFGVNRRLQGVQDRRGDPATKAQESYRNSEYPEPAEKSPEMKLQKDAEVISPLRSELQHPSAVYHFDGRPSIADSVAEPAVVSSKEIFDGAVRQESSISGLPASGLPASGLPASGLPASGLPASGLPASGLPASGLPASGLPASGLPASGLPASGLPASGLPASGLPASGLPASGLPASGLPASGLPASGLPASGLPASVSPASVSPASGVKSEQSSVPVSPASGLPSSGLPASGLPASGLPASGLPASGLPASGVKSEQSSVPGSPASGLPASGVKSEQSSVPVFPASGLPASGVKSEQSSVPVSPASGLPASGVKSEQSSVPVSPASVSPASGVKSEQSRVPVSPASGVKSEQSSVPVSPASGLPASGVKSEQSSVPGPPASGVKSEQSSVPVSPASGLPASGVKSEQSSVPVFPASGLPASGVKSEQSRVPVSPASVSPASGLPASGLPASGVKSEQSSVPVSPASGLPASGVKSEQSSVPVFPASGLPASGVKSEQSRVPVSPASVSPASGLPASGLPASGLPASGLPASGVKSEQSSVPVSPASGLPASGVKSEQSSVPVSPASGLPASGVKSEQSSVPVSPASGLPASGVKSEQSSVPVSPASGLPASGVKSEQSRVPGPPASGPPASGVKSEQSSVPGPPASGVKSEQSRVPGSPASGLPASGVKSEQSSVPVSPASGLPASVSPASGVKSEQSRVPGPPAYGVKSEQARAVSHHQPGTQIEKGSENVVGVPNISTARDTADGNERKITPYDYLTTLNRTGDTGKRQSATIPSRQEQFRKPWRGTETRDQQQAQILKDRSVYNGGKAIKGESLALGSAETVEGKTPLKAQPPVSQIQEGRSSAVSSMATSDNRKNSSTGSSMNESGKPQGTLIAGKATPAVTSETGARKSKELNSCGEASPMLRKDALRNESGPSIKPSLQNALPSQASAESNDRFMEQFKEKSTVDSINILKQYVEKQEAGNTASIEDEAQSGKPASAPGRPRKVTSARSRSRVFSRQDPDIQKDFLLSTSQDIYPKLTMKQVPEVSQIIQGEQLRIRLDGDSLEFNNSILTDESLRSSEPRIPEKADSETGREIRHFSIDEKTGKLSTSPPNRPESKPDSRPSSGPETRPAPGIESRTASSSESSRDSRAESRRSSKPPIQEESFIERKKVMKSQDSEPSVKIGQQHADPLTNVRELERLFSMTGGSFFTAPGLVDSNRQFIRMTEKFDVKKAVENEGITVIGNIQGGDERYHAGEYYGDSMRNEHREESFQGAMPKAPRQQIQHLQEKAAEQSRRDTSEIHRNAEKEEDVQETIHEVAQSVTTYKQAETRKVDQASQNATTSIESVIKKSQNETWTGDEMAAKLIWLLMKAASTFTFDHSSRVIGLSTDLAREIGMTDESELKTVEEGAMFHDIGETELNLQDASPQVKSRLSKYLGTMDLRNCSFLHDIGKVKIPDSILYKPGRLTDEEFEVLKQHPVIGEQILKPIPSMQHVLPVVRHHHEKWDGKGYPDGLKGEESPLPARIVSITDAYDAMVSDRPYRKGMPVEDALKELKRCAGSHFDPDLVEAFVRVIKRNQQNGGEL